MQLNAVQPGSHSSAMQRWSESQAASCSAAATHIILPLHSNTLP